MRVGHGKCGLEYGMVFYGRREGAEKEMGEQEEREREGNGRGKWLV